MGLICEDFMLKNEVGKRLYHRLAEDLPIIDYHCHLPVRMIAQDHRFSDATELFLGGDHYKWRQMRINGVPERLITGDAPPYEKWLAFADTLPLLIGNPIYHWTALELKRYFGVDLPLNRATAPEIYAHCTALLAQDGYTARGLIRRSGVEVLCTTDDPADDLSSHREIAASGFETRVLPAFRPDALVHIEQDGFLPYLRRCGIGSFAQLLSWLDARVGFFDRNGCRLADHALETPPFAEGDARAVFEKRLSGAPLTDGEVEVYQTAVLTRCAGAYAAHGWVMQLHLGALRNNNRVMMERLGPDTGFDAAGDGQMAKKLSLLLDSLAQCGALPKTVLYPLNPKDNYVIGTLLGCFCEAPDAGKIQFGSAWWFNDHRDGMREQLRTLAALGMLGRFIGMLTDSRSFVSYPRHEYFRRILCDLIGTWVTEGEYPDDESSLRTIVTGICYQNAKTYFGF